MNGDRYDHIRWVSQKLLGEVTGQQPGSRSQIFGPPTNLTVFNGLAHRTFVVKATPNPVKMAGSYNARTALCNGFRPHRRAIADPAMAG